MDAWARYSKYESESALKVENLRNQMEILIKELSNKIGNELFNKYLNEIRISHD